jgi:ABC-type polysaccharide/polyol phosphate export permease
LATATELWSYRTLIVNLTQRELKSRYKRSILGWLWSLLNPAATLFVYTLVFGVFFKIEPPPAANDSASYFAVYLFCGLVCWNLFSQCVNGGMGALATNGPLLKKVYFPPEIPVIANVVVVLSQTAVESVILIVLMVILGNVGITFILWPFVLLMLLCFSMGIALVVSVANVYFRDVEYLVGIVMQLLFYCTPIIYSIENVPEHVGFVPTRTLIQLNPLTQFVEMARDAFYFLVWPSPLALAGIVVTSVGTLAIGWTIFARASRDVSEVL